MKTETPTPHSILLCAASTGSLPGEALEVLQEKGFHVVEAGGNGDLHERIRQRQPDVVLLDLASWPAQRWEFLQKVRDVARFLRLPRTRASV